MDQSQIIQWNCRSISSKKCDIIYLANKYQPFLISLQETWLRPGFNFRIPKYSCIREDRSDGYGGVALLIKNNISFSQFTIPNHSSDFSIIAITINNICYVSLYIPHPTSSVYNEIESIFSIFPNPILIMGDFNAQHVAWGSSISNHYGSRLLDMVDKNKWCILNTGKATRRTQPHEEISAPDLSICTPNLASIVSWNTLSSSYGSDHFPIVINFPIATSSRTKCRSPRMKFKLENANWFSFKEEVEKVIPNIPIIMKNNHEVCAEAFALSLIQAAVKAFPVKKYKHNKMIPSPPWWDNECSLAIKKRKLTEKILNKILLLKTLIYYLV